MLTWAIAVAIFAALSAVIAFYNGLDDVHFGFLLASYVLALISAGLFVAAFVKWLLIGIGAWQA